MRNFVAATLLSTVAATATAQDFLHYKFDANCTTEVINYATGPQAFPANGTLQSNSTISPWDVGIFGGCLAGGANTAPTYNNRVITGWNPATQPITGSLTVAWFMRQRAGSTIGTGLNYLLGAASGGHRLFTNGVASTGLVQREILVSGGNNGPRDFQLPAATTNVQALAAAGWTHVAMVIDSTAQTADWYVNGVSVLQLPNVPGALVNLAGSYMIGGYSTAATGAGSVYDIDEFVMSLRAFTPTEMLAMSLAPRAGDGDYTSAIPSQCGAGNATLASVGGAPFEGNAAYALEVTTTTPSLYLLLVGFDRCTYGGSIPLPLDGTPLLPLLNGCWILADAPVTLGGATVGGPASNPLPIPAGLPYPFALYSQVLALDGATFASSMSNGFATSIGL
jgi:hypothetical protein